MKTALNLIIISLVTLFFINPISAQKDTIVLNFSDKTVRGIEKFKHPKPGKLYRVVIENINTNLYQVSINKNDSIIPQTNLPEDLFSLINLESINKLIAQIPIINGAKGSAATGTENLLNLFEKHSVGPENKTPPSNMDSLLAANPILFLLMPHFKNIANNQEDLAVIKGSLEEMKTFIYTYQLLEGIQDVNSDLYRSTSEQREIDVEELATGFINIRGYLKQTKDNIKADYGRYFTSIRPLIIDTREDTLNGYSTRIKEIHEEQLNLLAKIDSTISPETYKTLAQLLLNIKNNEDNEYCSLPLQFNGDFQVLSIKITPRVSSSHLQSYETEFTFPFQTKRDFWAISIGGYHSASLYDQDFVVEEAEGTFTIRKEKTGNFEVGANAMISMGQLFKANGSVGWHTGIGSGVSIGDKIKPRIMLGGGLVFGNKGNKLLFDGGVVMGSVDDISSLYEVDTPYSVQPQNVKISTNKAGFYLSLKYSILGK